MSLDETSVIFEKVVHMPESVTYEKGKESAPDLTWGHWIVVTHPVECHKTGNIIECQKHITVKPQNSLSLQLHKGREEIYKGMEGVTKICVNGVVSDLGVGDEVFLPRGSLHFSWNEDETQKSKFHEIQQGPLCDENDIKRAADKLKPDHMLHSDDEVLDMMINVARDRDEKGEKPHNDHDLLAIYQDFKNSPDLRDKMNVVLQNCKDIHFNETPNPKTKLQHKLAAE